jgi:DNA-binding CsgD family transcriptional regulator
VLVTELTASGDGAGNLSTLRSAFALTPSEVAFCRQLLCGDSVNDAAGHLGITVETARTRLKAIRQKTSTSSQGQLMLLLSRLR